MFEQLKSQIKNLPGKYDDWRYPPAEGYRRQPPGAFGHIEPIPGAKRELSPGAAAKHELAMLAVSRGANLCGWSEASTTARVSLGPEAHARLIERGGAALERMWAEHGQSTTHELPDSSGLQAPEGTPPFPGTSLPPSPQPPLS